MDGTVIRGIDEHTKLARASIDFDTDLDETFQINVAKMSVVLPADAEEHAGAADPRSLCSRGWGLPTGGLGGEGRRSTSKAGIADGVALREVGVALKAALLESQDLQTFKDGAGDSRSVTQSWRSP